MADETTSGSAFFGDADRVDRYLRHRHGSAASPNVTMEQPAFLAAVGNSEGLDIVELGCGDGSFASTAVAAGCWSYFGVDLSAPMLARARLRLAATTHAVFERAAIEDVQRPAASADLVVSRMALHYVADLDAVVRNVRGWLRPGGRAVFTVLHPVITCHDTGQVGRRQSWVVDGYFEPGPRTRIWLDEPVVWHHRTIEQYVAALIAADLAVTSLSECAPVAQLFAGNQHELARRRRVPLFLLLEGRAP
jgi:SAM-dependent methyltransferase